MLHLDPTLFEDVPPSSNASTEYETVDDEVQIVSRIIVHDLYSFRTWEIIFRTTRDTYTTSASFLLLSGALLCVL